MKTSVATPKRFTGPKPLKGGLGSSRGPLIPNKIQPRPAPPRQPTPTEGKSRPKLILPPRKLLALDTETTGVDLWHGCKPFFVSVCDEDGNLQSWEWDVDPFTRQVQIPDTDRIALQKLVADNDLLLHNTKFDIRGLETHGIQNPNWKGVQDTLIASHVLVSNEPHGLKPLAMQYLDIRDDDQKALQEATNKARQYGRSLGWRIAKEGDPHFPAQDRPKDGWWVCDSWLPRAVAKFMWESGSVGSSPKKPSRTLKRPAPSNHDWRPPGTDGPNDPGHPWWTVLSTYALRDVERTYGLWFVFKEALHEDHLWEIYEERRQLLERIYKMESAPATIIVSKRDAMQTRLQNEADAAKAKCIKIAKASGVIADETTLNSPKQLRGLLFGTWKLRPGKQTNSGEYSTDADTLKHLLNRSKGKPYEFIVNLQKARKCEKTLGAIEEYTLRSVGLDANLGDNTHSIDRNDAKLSDSKSRKTKQATANTATRTRDTGFRNAHTGARVTTKQVNEFIGLHFNFNITGTDTTRFSSSQPNGQNIGKQVIKDDAGNILADYNLRRLFGPRRGRVWYSIDYSNIELRIFAYESGDEKLIRAFELGYKVHCVFAEVLHPKEWHKCREQALQQAKKMAGSVEDEMFIWGLTADIFKTEYESTLYQWTKNGNFALIYGAGREKAGNTYHVPDAYDIIRHRLPLIDDFLAIKQQEAKTYGFVRCKGGFYAPDTFNPNYRPGYRLYVPENEPHVAVNYFIQGSAGWCMTRAINRVGNYLDSKPDHHMLMTIHDELVFDFPIYDEADTTIQHVGRLMERSGDDIGVPTPVEIERHDSDWAEGKRIKFSIAA